MPKNYQNIFKQVLQQVRPKPEEKKKIHALANKVLKVAKLEAKRYKAKPLLAGSLTRDTWLPGKMEFDIFIQFPSKLTEKKLEEYGLKAGKAIFAKMNGNYRIAYAQHPYVSGEIDGIRTDIVPCFDVKDPSKLKSAVDRTPFHVKYIEKHLPLKLSDEARLLKQFMTANGIYGADTKTQGFSGYVCELLIIKYKKFLEVLRASTKWSSGEKIDLEKFYTKKDYPHLKKQFPNQILILIDPTDKSRNTAAAVSSFNFFKFIKLAKTFLSSPSSEMFSKRKMNPINENELIQQQVRRRTELILVKFNPPDVVPDILWPQLRKFADRLQSILEEIQYEFKVLRKDCYTNEKDLAVVLLEMEVSKLPLIQKRVGPKVFDLDDSKRFLEKYQKVALNGPFVEDNFWVAEVKRKFISAREKIQDSLKDDVGTLKAKGVPNKIAEQLVKGVEIISENSKIMELSKNDMNFGIFIKQYFEQESLI